MFIIKKLTSSAFAILATIIIICSAASTFTISNNEVFATENSQQTNSTKSEQTSTSQTENTTSNITWPNAPKLTSKQAILMDADTGAILYEKEAYKRNFPASTTKIVTGLLVAQNASLSDTITISEEAAKSVVPGDSSLSSKAGEVYTVEEAMAGLLLHSANEIAYGLAENVSGDLSSFVDKMNQIASESGCLDTHFVNASGLYDKNHYSTPYDMALIARTCFNNPTFLSIDALETYTIPATNKTSTPRNITNRNKLLPGLMMGYEYCVGGKTGYLPEGGYTYVSYAEKDGMRLIAVCFDSAEFDRFNDAKKLFEWGYNNFKKVSLASSDLTASFSDSSYLNSGRYNTGRINRSFNASFVTLPNTVSLSDVSMVANPKHKFTVNEEEVNIPVAFKYGSHIVGTADLKYYNASNVNTDYSNLPLLDTNNIGDGDASSALVIDLRILLAIGIAILVFYIIFSRKRRKAKEELARLERRKRHRKRPLK